MKEERRARNGEIDLYCLYCLHNLYCFIYCTQIYNEFGEVYLMNPTQKAFDVKLVSECGTWNISRMQQSCEERLKSVSLIRHPRKILRSLTRLSRFCCRLSRKLQMGLRFFIIKTRFRGYVNRSVEMKRKQSLPINQFIWPFQNENQLCGNAFRHDLKNLLAPMPTDCNQTQMCICK